MRKKSCAICESRESGRIAAGLFGHRQPVADASLVGDHIGVFLGRIELGTNTLDVDLQVVHFVDVFPAPHLGQEGSAWCYGAMRKKSCAICESWESGRIAAGLFGHPQPIADASLIGDHVGVLPHRIELGTNTLNVDLQVVHLIDVFPTPHLRQ